MHFPSLCFLAKAQEEISFLFIFCCCCCCFPSVLGMEHRVLCMISKFSTTEPRPQPFSGAQGPWQMLYLWATPSCLSPATLGKLCTAKHHPSPSRTDSSQLSYSPPLVYPIPAHCVTAQTPHLLLISIHPTQFIPFYSTTIYCSLATLHPVFWDRVSQ